MPWAPIVTAVAVVWLLYISRPQLSRNGEEEDMERETATRPAGAWPRLGRWHRSPVSRGNRAHAAHAARR